MSKLPEVPKQRTTRSKTGMRRSHILAKLRKSVNRVSPVKALSKRELKQLAKRTEIKPKPKPTSKTVSAPTKSKTKPTKPKTPAKKPAKKKSTTPKKK